MSATPLSYMTPVANDHPVQMLSSAAQSDFRSMAGILPDLDQVREHFRILNRPGEVREVRILGHVPSSGYGGPSTAAGYFDSEEALEDALRGIDSQHATGIYITQNPVDPDLRARAYNRLERKAKQTTSDADISHLAHLTLDFDPVRKAGISATDDECALAIAQRDAFIRFVTGELGWPEPAVCVMSGNGGQVTWRVDLPANAEGASLVAAVLDAASALFTTDVVTVDTSLSNPSRIVKLSGTVAAKGDSLPERPHRRAHGVFASEAGTVSEAQLRALVVLAPSPESRRRPEASRTQDASSGSPYDVPSLLSAASIGYQERDKKWARVYELDRCLSSDDHNDGAAIFQFPSGAVSYKCFHERCSGMGWPDIKQRLRIRPLHNEDVGANWGDREAFVSFGSGKQSQNGHAHDWPEMDPLPAPTPAAPTMPAILVPEPLRPWVRDIAERTKLPLEMVAAPAIVASAAVVGRAVGLRPNQYDDFTVVASLWGALVARPGWMKSGACAEAFRPLGRLAADANAAYVQTDEANAVARERIDAEIDAIKRKMRDAAKKGEDLGGLEADLAGKRVELRAALTTERRYLTHDATVEKLGELLRDNPRGMLLLRDELSGWLRTLDRPGREGDREFFLEAWNGTGSFTTDRIGRGTTHIPALTLSLFGGIQPGKLGPLLSSAAEGGVGDDGLVQRLQVTVFPDRLPPWSKTTRWPDSAARNRASAIFDALAAMDGVTVKAHADDIPFLRYSPHAQIVADDWRDALEHRLRSDALDDVPAFASHLAKYRSLMPTLALVFYLIDEAAKTPAMTKGAVGEAHVRLAADWCDFLEVHARKLYAVELHAGASAAHALAARINGGAVFDGQSVRDLYRAQWAGLRTPERVLLGLNELTDLGWLRVEFVMTGGRPTQVVRLHPGLADRAKTPSGGTDRTDRKASVSSVSGQKVNLEQTPGAA
jgi:hypothetical protein